jgi:autotransporter strand-loop-strand O-heptosyltransferase
MKNSEETKKDYINLINNTQIQNNNSEEVIFNIHYVGNPFLEIKGDINNEFNVQFYDNEKLIHSSLLKCNMWTKVNRKYFTDWDIKVYDKEKLVFEDKINLKDKKVYVSIDSKSLGDTIAWVPYLEEFRKKHNCKLIASTFWNNFFINTYKDIEFINPGEIVYDLYAMYSLGWFYNSDSEPELPNTISLQKAASNILGLEHKEIKSDIYFIPKESPYEEKYVTIAPHSTAGLKYWNNESGWQEVIGFLKENGYKVINISKEGCDFEGVESLEDYSIDNTINVIHHSEFMIGLSSGLSWLSWGIGKHVVMISNFTEKDHEFTGNCTRIINENVCNGCWNNLNFKFDKGDWNWCPINKNTKKQFECHKEITGQMVIESIKELITPLQK